jgi:predicted O-methyltransferase YrrM
VGTKVRLLKGRTIDHLPKLIEAKEQFELIFVDGSHRTLDVMSDAALARQLLAPGGLMIFDNYWFDDRLRDDYRYTPKIAIDAFVGMMTAEIEVIDVAGQVFLRRLLRTLD